MLNSQKEGTGKNQTYTLLTIQNSQSQIMRR